MVVTAQEHYDSFLAEHYSWMFGDYRAKVSENKDFFKQLAITPGAGTKALDLGCGSGFQAIALADLGFKVLGIDLCETLLKELRDRRAGRDIDALQGDMLDLNLYADRGPFEVTVCMGDTLIHLQTAEDVLLLFENVHQVLEPGGRFVLTFRDLSAELVGVERIVPVRTDDDKLMATFLEYEETHVNVHDMIFVKGRSGWKMRTSVYQKLRIGADQVRDLLQNLEFKISCSQIQNGFSVIVARK